MPKFTAETAKEMRQRAIASRLHKKQLRLAANQLARNFLCQNPRAQLGIDLGTQLRVLHDIIIEQMSKVVGAARGSTERLHGLIQVERELVALLEESGVERNRVPGEIEKLINDDPEVARKGFEDGVRQLKQDGPIREP